MCLECPGCGMGVHQCLESELCSAACGFLASLNYPYQYPPNQRCDWLIRVESDKYIELKIMHFDLQDVAKSCDRDFLDFYDYDVSGNSVRIGHYCNLIWPPDVTYSSWSTLRIRFASDFETEGVGFLATYKAISYSGFLKKDTIDRSGIAINYYY